MKKKIFLVMISIFAIFTVFIDQFSKLIVNSTIKFGYTKEIIPNFFSITNARNFGAAWSILWDKRVYLILISVIAFLFVVFLIYRENVYNKYKSIYYGLLIGGIIGNLIDRVLLGYVVDFFDFTFFGFRYPIFNISDIAIVVSILLICVECFLPNGLFNKKNKEELEVIDFDE